MAWRKIPAAAHRSMPWKNGGGATAEIAIAPDGASVAGGFDWRLSIATIGADGPFSAFPGYRRTITLLAGDGVILSPDGAAPHRLDRPFEPYAFSGDVATGCRLLGGPCEDLNLMVARDRFDYEAAIWRPGAPLPAGAGTFVLFVCQGRARFATPEGGAIDLSPRDTLILPPGIGASPMEIDGDSVLFVARIAPRAAAAG